MVLRQFKKQRQVYKSLLFGSVMMIAFQSCCVKPRPSVDDSVIVVEKSEVVENQNGSYTVNKAWMLKRLQTERDLALALEQCLEGDK